MIGTLPGFLVDHWRLALGATALGAVLAMAYLAAEYIFLPAWRMRAARRRGPGAIEELMAKERRQLVRLEDEAAVSGEHGRPHTREIREEAKFRRLIVSIMERRIGGRWP